MVATADLLPAAGGRLSSSEEWFESRRRLSEDVLKVLPVGTGEYGLWPFVCAAFPLTRPDSGYGLLFFDGLDFFDEDLD